MKLKSIRVFFNEYDFEQVGVPPKSYGGEAIFDLGNGSEYTYRMTPLEVQECVRAFSESASNSLRQSAAEATPNAFVKAASSMMLEHQPVSPEIPF